MKVATVITIGDLRVSLPFDTKPTDAPANLKIERKFTDAMGVDSWRPLPSNDKTNVAVHLRKIAGRLLVDLRTTEAKTVDLDRMHSAYLVATLDLTKCLVVGVGVYDHSRPLVLAEAYTTAVVHETCALTYEEAAQDLVDWAKEHYPLSVDVH